MKIVAVVVTYNRCELLKKVVGSLRSNQPLSGIVVVNNGSTDETSSWLNTQSNLHVINQNNIGGSGGFYTGINEAMKLGADWIWCMDDDVFPHENCLETLMNHSDLAGIGILAPRRLMDGKIFCHDFQTYNLTNPFSSMYQEKLRKKEVSTPTFVVGTAFEGPLIKREVIEKIGLPNKDLFIFCDDTDYCLRATLAGYKILYVPSALMDKHKFFSNDSWTERSLKKKWKRYYQIRNSAYLNHHYGKNWGVRYIRGFMNVLGYILTAFVTAPFSRAWKWSDIPNLWTAFKDGVNERLGIYPITRF